MLDLDLDRKGVTPKDAATIILVRDRGGLEVLCVQRSKQSRFFGGAIVFPGGKLDADDASTEWDGLTTEPRNPTERALAVAATRETLEEAAILYATGAVDEASVLALRTAGPAALRAFLRERGLLLDLAALVPFARWVTPEAEARRYDTRFFLAAAPPNQEGAHDEHETTASFWAKPAEVLRRFEAGEVDLFPPTHHSLEVLAVYTDTKTGLAMPTDVAPICPRLVRQGDTMALTLPGDPEHEHTTPRIKDKSRYVLRGERWLAEFPP